MSLFGWVKQLDKGAGCAISTFQREQQENKNKNLKLLMIRLRSGKGSEGGATKHVPSRDTALEVEQLLLFGRSPDLKSAVL